MEEFKEIILNLGWPHVALLFAIFFSLLFRKPLIGFMSRIQSISKSGINAKPLPRGQSDKEQNDAVEQLKQVGNSMLIKEQELLIKEDLKKHGLKVEGDTNDILIRYLAATQIALSFEQVYSNIFGSQIKLLKLLNQVSGLGITPDAISKHYEESKNRNKEQYDGWNLERYLYYLRENVLLTTQQGNYHITVRGQEFLTWLTRVGYKEDKEL